MKLSLRPLSLLCFVLLSISLIAQTPQFQKSEYPVGAAARAVDEADFNHDGISDLVTADGSSNTVSVLLGLGAGKFGAATHFATGATPMGVLGIDVNHDGKPDIVTVNLDGNSISVLLGNGDGTFVPRQDISVGMNPDSIVAADFNMDGNIDLAVTNRSSKTISILLGDGQGHFSGREIDASQYDATPGASSNGILSDILAIKTGDFNGDGKPDLAYIGCCDDHGDPNVEQDGVIRVLAGDGAGNFAVMAQVISPLASQDLKASDINHDGFADLISVGKSSCGEPECAEMNVFLNSKAAPYFGKPNFFYSFDRGPFCVDANCSVPSSPHVGDFNGDGINDIAVLMPWATKTENPGSNYPYDWPYDWLVVFPGKADGTFGDPQGTLLGQQKVENNSAKIVLKDFNKDGRLDVVVPEPISQTVAVLLNAACASPSSDGVNVCSPAQNASVTSPVIISARAKVTGGVYRFDLWVDHIKVFTARNSGEMETSVTMSSGSHLLEFVAQNAGGTHVSASRTITVGSGPAQCAAPTSPGVVVCAPANNAQVHSTFNVQAFANVSGGVYRFELWAGSTKVLTVRDSGTMNSNVTLAPGTYTLQFVARNAAGTDREVKSVRVTVIQ